MDGLEEKKSSLVVGDDESETKITHEQTESLLSKSKTKQYINTNADKTPRKFKSLVHKWQLNHDQYFGSIDNGSDETDNGELLPYPNPPNIRDFKTEHCVHRINDIYSILSHEKEHKVIHRKEIENIYPEKTGLWEKLLGYKWLKAISKRNALIYPEHFNDDNTNNERKSLEKKDIENIQQFLKSYDNTHEIKNLKNELSMLISIISKQIALFSQTKIPNQIQINELIPLALIKNKFIVENMIDSLIISISNDVTFISYDKLNALSKIVLYADVNYLNLSQLLNCVTQLLERLQSHNEITIIIETMKCIINLLTSILKFNEGRDSVEISADTAKAIFERITNIDSHISHTQGNNSFLTLHLSGLKVYAKQLVIRLTEATSSYLETFRTTCEIIEGVVELGVAVLDFDVADTLSKLAELASYVPVDHFAQKKRKLLFEHIRLIKCYIANNFEKFIEYMETAQLPRRKYFTVLLIDELHNFIQKRVIVNDKLYHDNKKKNLLNNDNNSNDNNSKNNIFADLVDLNSMNIKKNDKNHNNTKENIVNGYRMKCISILKDMYISPDKYYMNRAIRYYLIDKFNVYLNIPEKEIQDYVKRLSLTLYDYNETRNVFKLGFFKKKMRVAKEIWQSREVINLRLTDPNYQYIIEENIISNKYFKQSYLLEYPLEYLVEGIRELSYNTHNTILKEDLDLYIAVNGAETVGSKEFFDLEHRVLDFLKDETKKVLLIHGASGSGKSLFSRYIEGRIWHNYYRQGRICLFIALPSLQDPNKNIIEQTLRLYGFNERQIRTMKEEREFLFLLDSYDEIQSKQNIYLSNRLNEYNAKTIITSRTEYLESLGQYRNYFETEDNTLDEAYIIPFNHKQMKSYFDKVSKKGLTNWKGDDFIKKIFEIPGLINLVQTPYMLKVLTEVLPILTSDRVEFDNRKITRYEIYEAFTEEHFKREKEKLLLNNIEIPNDFDEITSFRNYSMDLAIHLLIEETTSVISTGNTYILKGKNYQNEWDRFFTTSDPSITIARQGCQITRVGQQRSFRHKSLLEYFASRVFFNELLNYDEIQINKDSFLNQINLKTEFSILSFLKDMIENEENLINIFFQIIERSKTENDISIASSNSITILNKLKISFSHRDFRNIKIPYANLDGGIFEKTDLRNSDLTGVSIKRSYLSHANLNNAIMHDIEFGKKAYLRGFTYVPKYCQLSNKRKYMLVVSGKQHIHIWNLKTSKKVLDFNGTFFHSHEEQTQIPRTSSIQELVISTKTKKLFIKLSGRTFILWSMETKEVINPEWSGGKNSYPVLSPNEKYIAFTDADDILNIYKLNKNENTYNPDNLIEVDLKKKTDLGIVSYRFSHNNKLIFVGDGFGSFVSYDIIKKKIIEKIKLSPNGKALKSIQENYTATKIIALFKDGGVLVWDIKNDKLAPLPINEDDGKKKKENIIISVLSPSSKYLFLATAGSKPKGMIWNTITRQKVYEWSGVFGEYYESNFSTDDNYFSVQFMDRSLQIFDLRSGQVVQKLLGLSNRVSYSAFCSNDSELCYLIDATHVIQRLSVDVNQSDDKNYSYSKYIHNLIHLKQSNQIVSVDNKDRVQIVDAKNGDLIWYYGMESDVIDQTKYWFDFYKKSHFLKIFPEGGIKLIKVVENKQTKSDEIIEFDLVDDNARSVIESYYIWYEYDRLVTSHSDGKIRIWNLKQRKVIRILTKSLTTNLRLLKYSPNGDQLIAATSVGDLFIWNLELQIKKQPRLSFDTSKDMSEEEKGNSDDLIDDIPPLKIKAHSCEVTVVSFSNKNPFFLTGSAQNVFYSWDLNLKKRLKLYGTPNKLKKLLDLKYLNNDENILSIASDHSFKLWDSASGECLKEFLLHHELIKHLTIIDNRIYTGGQSAGIRCWEIKLPSKSNNNDDNDDDDDLDDLSLIDIKLNDDDVLEVKKDDNDETNENIELNTDEIDLRLIWRSRNDLILKNMILEDDNLISSENYDLLKQGGIQYFSKEQQLKEIKGGNMDWKDNLGNSIAHLATKFNHMEVLQALKEKGFDFDTTNDQGDIPLHYAIRYQERDGGRKELIKFLLDATDNVDLANAKGETPLMQCFGHNSFETAKILLDNGGDVNTCDVSGKTPLIYAATYGDKELLQFLIDNGAQVNLTNPKGRTALYTAVKYGYYEVTKQLIDQGADINIMDKDGMSAFDVACLYGYIDLVRYLHHKGASVNGVDYSNMCSMGFGKTPLYHACDNLQPRVVEYLLAKGADLEMSNKKKETPLWIASHRNCVEIVEMLDKAGADINKTNSSLWTPVFDATYLQNEETIRYLVENGADLSINTNSGYSLLYLVASEGRLQWVKYFLEHGGPPNDETREGYTPLYLAIQNNFPECVKLLIKHGADPNKLCSSGYTNLNCACTYNHYHILQILIDGGASVDEVGKQKTTSLMNAAELNAYECVEILLDNHAFIDAVANDNATALYLAAYKGHTRVVHLLLERGANPNIKTDKAVSPLYIASQKGYLEIVEDLIAHGANINDPKSGGYLPVYISCYFGHLKVFECLINHGAHMEAESSDKPSNLMVAAEKGFLDIVNYLVRYGVDINRLDGKTKYSPLYVACKAGNVDIVEYLIDNGANVKLGWKDVSPLYIAAQNGFLQVVELLVEAGADLNQPKEGGFIPLYSAIYHHFDDVAEYLIKAGTDLSIETDAGESLVSIATEKVLGGSIDISVLKSILDSGGDINSRHEVRSSFDTTITNIGAYGLPTYQLYLEYDTLNITVENMQTIISTDVERVRSLVNQRRDLLRNWSGLFEYTIDSTEYQTLHYLVEENVINLEEHVSTIATKIIGNEKWREVWMLMIGKGLNIETLEHDGKSLATLASEKSWPIKI